MHDVETRGEWFASVDHVVVAPACGRFDPEPELHEPGPGELDLAGLACGFPDEFFVTSSNLGRVGDHSVQLPAGARFVAWLAWPGERVVKGQPLAWLRSDSLSRLAPASGV